MTADRSKSGIQRQPLTILQVELHSEKDITTVICPTFSDFSRETSLQRIMQSGLQQQRYPCRTVQMKVPDGEWHRESTAGQDWVMEIKLIRSSRTCSTAESMRICSIIISRNISRSMVTSVIHPVWLRCFCRAMQDTSIFFRQFRMTGQTEV